MSSRRVERILVVPVALAVGLVLAACAPDVAEPVATPSASSSRGSTDASPSSEPAVTLPDCDAIYSPAVVASLESEGRENQGDVSADGPGGWGTSDPAVEAVLSSLPDRVSCTWILPASESGSTTSMALLDDTARTSLLARFASAGFAASTAPSGDLYTLMVEDEFGSYTESHLLTEQLWIASVYFGGDATALTLDAAATVVP